MPIKDYIPLNFELMKNPINWVIIFLMVALAGTALVYILQSFSGQNVSNDGKV